jgi:hypothetical protein
MWAKDEAEAGRHVAHFYGADDGLLTRKVGRYLRKGLRRGEGVVVIATPAHTTALLEYLRRDGRQLLRAMRDGRLALLDAQDTLNTIMVGGTADRGLFERSVGEAVRAVRQAAGTKGFRAFAELVGLAWRAGHSAAAVRLEECWNELLRGAQASLFCSYPIDILSAEFQIPAVDALLCAHTRLVPAEGDLDGAVRRAVNEVLGLKAKRLNALIENLDRPSWAVLPRAEATILWVRNILPGAAEEILGRARRYYEQGLAAA